MRNTKKQKEKHRTSRLKILSLDSLMYGGVRGEKKSPLLDYVRKGDDNDNPKIKK